MLAAVPKRQTDILALAQTALATAQNCLAGQDHNLELSFAALFAGGHVLLEGPPGVGKTTIAVTTARVFQCEFKRIQMTSDLLPSEVIGGLRPAQAAHDFEFRRGPVFTNVLLVDELNRAGPKTQAALLEAMAEGTVTVDGVTHPLPSPHFVVATQNPGESFGVYPLPESQLDRFMIYASVSHPAPEFEFKIYRGELTGTNIDRSYSLSDLQSIREFVKTVFVDNSVTDYVQRLVLATRTHQKVRSGASVRAGLHLLSAARGLAVCRGRDFVSPQDVHDLAVPVLSHRLVLHEEDAGLGAKRQVLIDVVEQTQAPR